MTGEVLLQELQRGIKLAVGCTEPAAIALAAAHATAALGELPQEVEVILDPQTYRNALAVGLPYTSLTGPAMSAALGVFLSPQKELLIFADLDPYKARKAEELYYNGRVRATYDPSFPDLYIEVRVKKGTHKARACIKYAHTNLVFVEGPRFTENKYGFTSNQALKFNLWKNISFQEIFPLLDQLAAEDLRFLYQAAQTNLAMAKCGLKKGSGMALGRKLLRMSQQALTAYRCSDFNWLGMCLAAQALACAAVDARMSGEPLPVATLGGSGNQGITSLLPVWLLAKKLRVKYETVVKSLALSATVTLWVKNKLGSLSRICSSAFAGGWGIAAATLWLLGGDFSSMTSTLCNLASSLSGIICDGAKPSCSLKVMVGVETALKTALLTLQGLAVCPSGLVAETVDRTLENVANLARVGMAGVDQILLRSNI